MPLGGPCVWSNQDTDEGGTTPGAPVDQQLPTQGGTANEPPPSSTVAVHNQIVVEILKSGGGGPVRISAYATQTPFEDVEIKLARGERLLCTVKLKTLKTTPMTIELHHRTKLTAGLSRIAVYVAGTRRFDHVYRLTAAQT